jgi:translation initiation factor 1 (eIF-1/SUI1)
MEGTSRVVFGPGAHTIGGATATSFNNLTINSSQEIAVNESITILNQLTLTNGYLVPADTKLVTMENGSTVTGVSDNAYIRGAVKKIGTNGNTNYAFDFPIGKSGTAFYYPVRITFPNASSTEEVTVSYHDLAYSTNLRNSNVKEVASEYWMITPSVLVANASGLQVKMKYKSPTATNYLTGATNVNYYKVGHFSTSTTTWEVAVGLDAAQNSVDAGSTLSEGFATATGVTNFSRFTTIEITASVLPIQLSQFSAREVPGNKVVLNWSTDQEQHNKGFVIERASTTTQGKFIKIGYVYSKAVNGNASNVLNYHFNDGITFGDNYAYYRLLQEDVDGRTSPSEIRHVKFNKQTPVQIAVEPSAGKVTITRNTNAKKLNYKVIDQLGRIIGEGKSIVDQVFTINIQGNGVYNIHLHLPETGEQLIKRVMIQK